MARVMRVWNETTSSWEDVAVQQPDTSTFVQKSLVDAKGDIVAATGDNSPAKLPVGSDGQVLVANSGAATGLEWGTIEPLPDQTGNAGKFLSTDGSDASWANAVSPSIATAKGDLIAATGSGVLSRLGVGSNGQVLTANSSAATGLQWSSPPATGASWQLLATVTSFTTTTTVSGLSGYDQIFVEFDNLGCPSGTTLSMRLNADTTTNYRTSGHYMTKSSSFAVTTLSSISQDFSYFYLAQNPTGAVNAFAVSGGLLLSGCSGTGAKIGSYTAASGSASSNTISTSGVVRYNGTSPISSFSILNVNAGTMRVYGSVT